MKNRRFTVFMRGFRMALDPSLALRRHRITSQFAADEETSFAQDWYAVGGDMRVALKKFADEISVPRARRLSSGA